MKSYAIAYRMMSLFYSWMQSILIKRPQATKVSSGWIRKGVDKPIETKVSRTRMNVVGAIRLNHLAEAVVHDYETVNGSSITVFLEQVNQ
jgi:hypothetical protein